ncbi:hypothetical protein Pth03_16950 [Planotetraspora thailandica]|uniref:Uncharacterized protein n=1 Tax=Planotetraspora thailandica TaxID=487172 RepID=A0A8J3UYM2_9ACTN|nr:hypothetical protein Pth03_16950 [Planotetraspora thailandica]
MGKAQVTHGYGEVKETCITFSSRYVVDHTLPCDGTPVAASHGGPAVAKPRDGAPIVVIMQKFCATRADQHPPRW